MSGCPSSRSFPRILTTTSFTNPAAHAFRSAIGMYHHTGWAESIADGISLPAAGVPAADVVAGVGLTGVGWVKVGMGLKWAARMGRDAGGGKVARMKAASSLGDG